jgi:phospholipase/carboxylesterase
MHRFSIIEQGAKPDKAKKAIILLHGRGGSAEDIITLADEFCDDTYYIAAPQATGDTWYPFTFLAPEEKNEPWLSSAIDIVMRLIGNVTKFIPTEKIFIMGFSQGACLSLETAARHPAKYGGIAAFSGGLIGDKINGQKYIGDFAGTKIFIGNSDKDPHIPDVRVKESAEMLRSMGADVHLRIYNGMGHTIIREEIEEVRSLMFRF